jgi:magnesium chelatase family protein
MHVEVPPVPVREISSRAAGESSQSIRERVNRARRVQQARFAKTSGVSCNARMSPRQIESLCLLDEAGRKLLGSAIDRLGLSARAYHRIIKIARTIADLAESEQIALAHLAEAVQYRRQQQEPGC